MKKVILITGVSSGFGKEAAVLMAQAGYTVYGTVRKTVKPLQGVNILYMDLTQPASI
ncbi:MAG: SDR family NAD(P)-dependent oxidoreductase, partial [Bacteroidales bacterium]|nr:SDR family NAD(P)-dependent oxidoreductase [Bacteroidales bacterium]